MGMKADHHPYKWEVIHDLVFFKGDVNALILSYWGGAFIDALSCVGGMETGTDVCRVHLISHLICLFFFSLCLFFFWSPPSLFV